MRLRQQLISALTLMPILLLSTLAHAAELNQVAKFSLPDQTQVLNFVATKNRVYTSVRFDLPNRTRKHELAAWTTKGKLLWRVETEGAYQLVLADSQLVLSHDEGSISAKRGMIWFDVKTGKESHRIGLDGRPSALTFHLHTKLVSLIVMPEHRLRTLEGAWMEVRGYNSKAQLVWARKESVTSLASLSNDEKYLVVASFGQDGFTQRLDPASGRIVWKRKHTPAKLNTTEVTATNTSQLNLQNLLILQRPPTYPNNDWWWEFADMATGKTIYTLKEPQAALPTDRSSGASFVPLPHNRIYLQWYRLEKLTLAALEFPSGHMVWADETKTVSYNRPVQWTQNVVFMCRRLSEGLTGHVTLTEIRVYDQLGRLLVHEPVSGDDSNKHWGDTIAVQSVGNTLYAVKGPALVALKLNDSS